MLTEKNVKSILRKKNENERPFFRGKRDDFSWWKTALFFLGLIGVIFLALKFLVKPVKDKLQPKASQERKLSAEENLMNGKIDEAAKQLEEVLRADPNNLEASLNMAIVKYDRQQYDDAINDLNSIIQKDSKNAKAYNILGNIYRDQKKNDEAAKNYRQAISLDPQLIFAYSNLIVLLADNNGRAEASKVLADGLKANPDSEELKNLQEFLKPPSAKK